VREQRLVEREGLGRADRRPLTVRRSVADRIVSSGRKDVTSLSLLNTTGMPAASSSRSGMSLCARSPNRRRNSSPLSKR
jgi:hypothetical protein